MAAFVSVYRERPAFVVIWLRGRGNQSVRDFGREHNRRVAAGLHALATDLGLLAPGTPVRVAELAVEIGDRLFQLAFEDSLTGDPEVLAEAERAVVGYLHLHAAPAGRRAAGARLPRCLRPAHHPSPQRGPVNEITARRAVVEACHRAAQERLVVGTAGNASQRYGDRVAITATGAVLGRVTEDEVVVLDLDGSVVEGDLEPTSEVDLHLGLYRAHPPGTGVDAVMHVHAPVSVAVGTVVDELPVIHYQQLLLGGEVRVAPYSTFGSSDLADDVSAALTDRRAALMANHGSVAVAGTVAEALEHALLLEWLCGVYRDARALGTPRVLDAAQQQAVVEAALARSYGTLRRRPTSEESR